jgi:hypothetical protein
MVVAGALPCALTSADEARGDPCRLQHHERPHAPIARTNTMAGGLPPAGSAAAQFPYRPGYRGRRRWIVSSRLCSAASQLLRRHQTSQTHSSAATAPRLPAFPPRTVRNKGSRPGLSSPGSRTKSIRTCQGRRPRRVEAAARNNPPARVDFRLRNDVGTRDPKVSRLNGWPMRTPPDASPTPSRVPTYGLGPMWFATPSS